MIRLSSNATLFYKIVFPLFFLVLYGLFTLFILIAENGPFDELEWIRYSNLIFYIAIVLILYKTVFQLQRIDCNEDNFVITNYRKAFRYSYDSVKEFRTENLFFWTLAIIEFKSPSFFGNRITVLIDKNNLEKIYTSYGNVFDK